MKRYDKVRKSVTMEPDATGVLLTVGASDATPLAYPFSLVQLDEWEEQSAYAVVYDGDDPKSAWDTQVAILARDDAEVAVFLQAVGDEVARMTLDVWAAAAMAGPGEHEGAFVSKLMYASLGGWPALAIQGIGAAVVAAKDADAELTPELVETMRKQIGDWMEQLMLAITPMVSAELREQMPKELRDMIPEVSGNGHN